MRNCLKHNNITIHTSRMKYIDRGRWEVIDAFASACANSPLLHLLLGMWFSGVCLHAGKGDWIFWNPHHMLSIEHLLQSLH